MRCLPLTAIASFLLAAATLADEPLAFEFQDLSPGTRVNQKWSETTDAEVVGPKESNRMTKQGVQEGNKVVQKDADGSLLIHYGTVSPRGARNNLIANHRFRLTPTENDFHPTVIDLQTDQPAGNETSLTVANGNTALIGPNPLRALLASRPPRVGNSYTLREAEIRDLIHWMSEIPPYRIRSMDLTLREIDKENVIFDVVINQVATGECTGSLVVRREGMWPLSLNAEGEFTKGFMKLRHSLQLTCEYATD